jgi:glutathione S-transferase
MAFTLYNAPQSTCSQRVRFVLNAKRQAFDEKKLDLLAGDQLTPEYLKLNPNGVVPTLVHDGVPIIESTVINEYIDQVWPTPPLRPADAHDRARMRLWTKQLDEGLHAASATISACIAFRYQFMAGKTEAELKKVLDGFVDPVKRKVMSENVLNGVDSSFFRPAMLRVKKMLDDMEAALARGPWLAGAAYSLADIAVAPYVTRVDHLQLGDMIAARGHLADWYARIQARSAYRTAMVDWFVSDFIALMKEKGAEERGKVEAAIAA